METYIGPLMGGGLLYLTNEWKNAYNEKDTGYIIRRDGESDQFIRLGMVEFIVTKIKER